MGDAALLHCAAPSRVPPAATGQRPGVAAGSRAPAARLAASHAARTAPCSPTMPQLGRAETHSVAGCAAARAPAGAVAAQPRQRLRPPRPPARPAAPRARPPAPRPAPPPAVETRACGQLVGCGCACSSYLHMHTWAQACHRWPVMASSSPWSQASTCGARQTMWMPRPGLRLDTPFPLCRAPPRRPPARRTAARRGRRSRRRPPCARRAPPRRRPRGRRARAARRPARRARRPARPPSPPAARAAPARAPGVRPGRPRCPLCRDTLWGSRGFLGVAGGLSHGGQGGTAVRRGLLSWPADAAAGLASKRGRLGGAAGRRACPGGAGCGARG